MNPKKNKSLEEKKGIYTGLNSNDKIKDSIQNKRKAKKSASSLFSKIVKGDIAALSQAITLVESTNDLHSETSSEILKRCLAVSGNSIRIGITGVPGVGKSTFIEAFGNYLLTLNKKIAILAVDPTSQTSKGSILGDKTRMEKLSRNTNAFIRPTPAGNSLGGVARKTRETIILCEAAGFEIILIETVGVGQSEIAVHSMVDFFLLLKLAGAGDELQGIKRGIIEMADLVAINKADGDNINAARKAKIDFKNALHLYPAKESGLQTEVFLCSALNNEGLEDIWKEIKKYSEVTRKNGFFLHNRLNQKEYWLMQTIEEELKSNFLKNPEVRAELKNQLELLKANKTTAYGAAQYLLSL